MKLTTPRWWYVRDRAPGFVMRHALRPLSWIWASATARRIANTRPFDPGVPVISVGNLTVGGSGKTPVVREVLARLSAKGVNAQGLSRGYGGNREGPHKVDPYIDTAADVGDEALMLAHDGAFWIAHDRAAGARAAVDAGAMALVLDDAHQNPALKKTLSLVVVDGETRDNAWPFGDGAVFPSGPMREPFGVGMARADAVVLLLPADLAEPDPDLVDLFRNKPLLIARPRTGRAAATRTAGGFRRHRQAVESRARAESSGVPVGRLHPLPRPPRLHRRRHALHCRPREGLRRRVGHHRKGLGAPFTRVARKGRRVAGARALRGRSRARSAARRRPSVNSARTPPNISRQPQLGFRSSFVVDGEILLFIQPWCAARRIDLQLVAHARVAQRLFQTLRHLGRIAVVVIGAGHIDLGFLIFGASRCGLSGESALARLPPWNLIGAATRSG